jgi:2-methylcitrate dehydratase PrpD
MPAAHAASPLTSALAAFVAEFSPERLPHAVRAKTRDVVLDGAGALLAATEPALSTGQLIAGFVESGGGTGKSTIIGRGARMDPVSAALANGTMGYACDVEPFHTEAVLHPIACILPAALAVAEHVGADGAALLGAVALGCEVEYRVSMAIGPVEQYNLGFHPSAVCGAFGTAAAAAALLRLDGDAVERTFGLTACQASGLMAWESDPTENARPFQMGMAARNGVTAALLAQAGFGGPRAIFDHGHTVFRAFSRNPRPELLTKSLGEGFKGVTELAIKPYSCVAFLHPGLDALLGLQRDNRLAIGDIDSIALHFARSGTHCIDGNPLKSHCAQYVLPVALTPESLRIRDLFFDRRESDADVARLSSRVTVVKDDGALEQAFPEHYATVVEIRCRDGRVLTRRQDIARGSPEAPLSDAELRGKFELLAGTVASPKRIAGTLAAVDALWDAPQVEDFARCLRAAPGT